MSTQLVSVPRVTGNAPNKNTIEWAIPNKVKVCFMLIETIGYTITINVEREKKHWWNRRAKEFVFSSSNPVVTITKGTRFLEKYGYYIDANTVSCGEEIGFRPKSSSASKDDPNGRATGESNHQRLLDFSQAEMSDRTEWLFWECYKQIWDNLHSLSSIHHIDESRLAGLRDQVFYETLLWNLGESIAVLRGFWNNRLTDEDIDEISSDFFAFMEIMFPAHKYYETIDVFANYMIESRFTTDPKKLREEMASYYIWRLGLRLGIDHQLLDHQETRDSLNIRFPYGWLVAADAFLKVPISDIRARNLISRQCFRNQLLEAKERADRVDSVEETEKRQKWEEDLDEFNRLAGQALEEVDAEIKRRSDLKE